MVLKTFIIATLLTSYVASDSCVLYKFENSLDIKEGNIGICDNLSGWMLDNYSNSGIDSPNEASTKFITPTRNGVVSCWSSFLFSISPGGTLEVTIYMDSDAADNLQFFAIKNLAGSRFALAGHVGVDPIYVRGWQTVSVPLFADSTYEGYLSALGVASENSTVIIDSFRYVPPGMDESLCRVYE